MNSETSKHPDYYEAILQLRPVTEEMLDFINEIISRRNDVKISKIIELKKNIGIDIYLTNQRFTRGTLGPQLKKKFKGGELIISKALYGRHKRTNRLIYRATVLFRMPKKRNEEISQE